MVNLNEESIRKRLLAVNQTQEAVQTCSKWILHHRDAIDRIATCWINVYKKASDKLRIALIYVLNDVVQKAANKRDNNVTLAFHPHWINASAMSNVSVKKGISRCVEVLEQRGVYPGHIIEEMKAALVSRVAMEKDESQSGEIDFSHLIRAIENFNKNEIQTEKAREILARSAFNFKESIQARVKDRAEGVKALSEMDSSRQKMILFLESMERHQQKGLKLIETMQQAKQSFNLQLKDVTVVNDAYEKFAEGIHETKTQLESMQKSGIMPGAADASPPRDAPSPTAGEDPFIHGVGEEAAGGESEDMEMDEDDAPSAGGCFLKPSKDYVASIPAVPEMDPRLQRLVNATSSSALNQQQALSESPNLKRAMVVDPRQLVDPRQARFFPPPQQPPPQIPLQMNFMPPSIPPPGLSPPPQNQSAEMLNIDTSLPPPQLFSMPPPHILNGNGIVPSTSGMSISPPIAMFNPSNPPPSILASQIQSPTNPQMNFSVPPPSLIKPLSLNQVPASSMNHVGEQKRRNSAGEEFSPNLKQMRMENQRWNEDNNSGGNISWRRSFTGESGGRYRH